MLKTVNKRLRWFWERCSGLRARDLTILLLLVCKTVGKITMILFLALSKGGGSNSSYYQGLKHAFL